MGRFLEFEAFAQVARTESFTAAAAALGVTPSAVSKQIRSLEERLGARLLNRTTRRVSLTEVGRAFHERVDGLLDDLAEAEESVRQLHSQPRGTLRVGIPMDFGRSHLAQPIATFMANHPELELEVEFADRFVDLISEGFDVVIRIGALSDSSFVARRLARCRRVICASPAYLGRAGVPQLPRDLLRHERIAYAYEAERAWSFEEPEGPTPIAVPVRHRSNNGEMTRHLLLAGLGIALLPTFLVGDDIRAGRLRVLLENRPQPDLAVQALYPHRKHLSAKVRRFVDHLAEHCGDEPYWDHGL